MLIFWNAKNAPQTFITNIFHLFTLPTINLLDGIYEGAAFYIVLYYINGLEENYLGLFLYPE